MRKYFLLTLFTLAFISCEKEIPVYTVTVSSSPSEGGSVSPQGGEYQQGQTASFTATPNEFYGFAGWSGADTSTINPVSIIVDTNKSLTARFEKLDTDNDGVTDDIDQCPDTPESEQADSNGCSVSQKNFELTVAVEGEGTVTEEVVVAPTIYQGTTQVQLTAVPAEGWEFTEWTGNATGTDNPITIEIDSTKNITAVFTKKDTDGDGIPDLEDSCADTPSGEEVNETGCSSSLTIFSSTNVIENKSGATYQITDDTLYNSHGTIYYKVNGNEYLLFPGFGFEGDIKGSPILFKRINNIWKFLKRFDNIGIEGIRNQRQIDEYTYLLAEASENSPEDIANGAPIGRPSNIWIVKLKEGDAEWTKVNTTQGFYHDASFGDINGDGLIDVVAAGGPGQVFIRQSNGSFNEYQDVFPMQHGAAYFSIEMGELYGDSTPEIVWTSYIDGGAVEHLNTWIILKWDSSTNTFYEDKRSNDPRVFHPTGDMGGNHTRIVDINKDGYNDMIIGREGEGGSYQGSVEIWLGDGTGNFEPKDMETNYGSFYAVDFSLLDVNNDGYDDIVFGTEREGSIRVGSRWEQGFILNDLIRINNGDGSFDRYNGYEIKGGEGTVYEKFMPFIRNNKLMFIGTFTESDALFGGPGNAKSIIYETTINNIY